MLPKKERLDRSAFNHFFKLGKRHHSPIATLIMAPHTNFHGSVVVGKKVAKSAVKRNCLRRISYGVLYETLKQKDQTGVYILILKPTIVTFSQKLIRSQLRTFIESTVKNT